MSMPLSLPPPARPLCSSLGVEPPDPNAAAMCTSAGERVNRFMFSKAFINLQSVKAGGGERSFDNIYLDELLYWFLNRHEQQKLFPKLISPPANSDLTSIHCAPSGRQKSSVNIQ